GLGLLALTLYNRAVRHANRFVVITGKGYQHRRLPLGRWRVPALAFMTLYIAFAAALPAVTLVWTSLFGFLTPGKAALADASLAAWRSFLGNPTFWRAFLNSFLVAGLSALIVSLVGGLIAWTVARTKLPGRRALDMLSFMSLGVPSVIAGL